MTGGWKISVCPRLGHGRLSTLDAAFAGVTLPVWVFDCLDRFNRCDVRSQQMVLTGAFDHESLVPGVWGEFRVYAAYINISSGWPFRSTTVI